MPEVELSSNDLLIDLARIGLGVAFLPDYCVPRSKTLFTIKTMEELPERKLVAAYSEQLPLPKTAENFLSYFKRREAI